MNFKRLFLACIIGAGSFGWAVGQSNMNDPMTKAMMDVYNQEIAANPQNYEVYFRRANEYYKFNQYLRALADVDNAIKFAPATDSDMLFQCHLLRGEIYQMLEKPAEALADFSEALKFDPTSFMALYQKANCEYELGQYAEAKTDFNRLRSNNGRSTEALTGLARIAVKENNLGLAQEYMDDAVAMMSADSDVYVRRSSVRRMLGNNPGAVDDLIMAISLDNNSKAFQQLTDMANIDYPAVITALSNAIHQAPEQGMFIYIRAVIAQAHEHFPQAIADYQKLIDGNFYNYAGIYGSLAECHYALCDFQQALDNVNRAIGMGADNGEYQLTMAKICRAQKRYDDAMTAVDRALAKLPANQDVLTEKGLILFSQGKFDDASTLFAEMIIDNPEAPMNYLNRGWVMEDGLKKHSDALAIYRRMAGIDTDATSPRSLHGFALLFSGKKDEAITWADNILKSATDSDGSTNYIAACLYAQAGELQKATECVEAALGKGYSNKYNLTMNNESRVNLAPLRANGTVDKIIASYSYIFEQ